MNLELPGSGSTKVLADRGAIDLLRDSALIAAPAHARALDWLHPPRAWGRWASRLLLHVGSALVLCGVVFFFAFNWASLPAAAKFAIIEVALVACLATALLRGLERLSGKVALLAACLLVGVFLAVFGQVYQTGADAWQLFFGWAALSLGWVLIANFAPLWALWLVVLNAFALLFWEQWLQPVSSEKPIICSLLALANGAFLVARERLAHRGVAWVGSRWTRRLLALTTLTYGLIPALVLIVDGLGRGFALPLGAGLTIAIHAGFLHYYRVRSPAPDLWVLAFTVLSLCILLETIGFELVQPAFRRDEALGFLSLSVLTVCVFSVGLSGLKRLTREHPHG